MMGHAVASLTALTSRMMTVDVRSSHKVTTVWTRKCHIQNDNIIELSVLCMF